MPEQTQPQPKSSQVKVPYPPDRYDRDDGRFREEPEVSVQESYRRNVIRVALPGTAMIDVVPADGGDRAVSSVDPATIFDAASPVWIVSGCNAFGRLCTLGDQAATTAVLLEQFDSKGWTWHPAVLMDPGRQWVETGAVVLGPSRDEMVSMARYHGQEAVLLWDEHGVRTIATGLADDVVDGPLVAVATSSASLGCPMRFGAEAVCVRQGGPYVSRSIEVASFWEKHRALLVSALGCSVCQGGVVDGNGRPIAVVSSFVPSRRGGWQAGPPLSSASFDAAMSDGD
jgi:Protein of unknown function (DUF3293)